MDRPFHNRNLKTAAFLPPPRFSLKEITGRGHKVNTKTCIQGQHFLTLWDINYPVEGDHQTETVCLIQLKKSLKVGHHGTTYHKQISSLQLGHSFSHAIILCLDLKQLASSFPQHVHNLKKSKKKTNPTPHCLRITLKSSSHLILNLSAWTLSRYHLKSPNFRAKTWPCDESLWSTKKREKRNSLKVFTLKVSLKVTLNMLQIISTI